MAKASQKERLLQQLNAEEASIDSRFSKAAEIAEAIGPATTIIKTPESKLSPKIENPVKKNPIIKRKKVIRDMFSLPEHDYALIEKMRNRCLKRAVAVSKSEVIRAGLNALNNANDKVLVEWVNSLEKMKPGPDKKK